MRTRIFTLHQVTLECANSRWILYHHKFSVTEKSVV